jgi:hypothetical protein
MTLLEINKESKEVGKIHSPFNANFIENIPKEEEPEGFEQYCHISLCTCVYKIIAKTISCILKPHLS